MARTGTELTAARLRHAADLLFASPLSVAEVAETVGYKQAAHFAKAFRGVYGSTPLKWRREERRRRASEFAERWFQFIEERRLAQQHAEEERLRQWAEEKLREATRRGQDAWPRGLPPPE